MAEVVWEVAAGFWAALCQMAPYLLFGFAMAGLLSVLLSPEWIERHLGRRGMWSVVKASLFGVPLPLCSCGVIPVAASLRRHGAGRGATAAFLLSTPQTGVDSIFVTWSLLGPIYAAFRPVAALLTGIFGGALVTLFGGADDGRNGGAGVACGEACCAPGGPRQKLVRALHYGFVTLPQDIGRSLLVGLVIAGLIGALVPEDFFVEHLGKGLLAILVMMALGIPIYVCATASIPIAAALIWKGATPGAALAFLISGPATNAATVAVIWRTMGRRTVWLYLLSVAVCAVGMALLLDQVMPAGYRPPLAHAHEHGPSPLGIVSAVALLAVLGRALILPYAAPKRKAAPVPEEAEGMRLSLAIEGMTCKHCVANVMRTLKESPGVRSAEVDLKTKRAVVVGDDLDAQAMARAVESLGYRVSKVEAVA